MKAKTIVLTLALCFVAAAVCFADDAFTGTWKLNEAKSKMAPNAPKNNTVVYEAAGDNVKITVDGIGNDGKPTHDEWTGKFDGKDYAVTGNPNSDMRSYTKIDDHTLGFNVKKGGKVTTSGRVVVSADGKSRTVTTSGTDAQGKKFKHCGVRQAVNYSWFRKNQQIRMPPSALFLWRLNRQRTAQSKWQGKTAPPVHELAKVGCVHHCAA